VIALEFVNRVQLALEELPENFGADLNHIQDETGLPTSTIRDALRVLRRDRRVYRRGKSWFLCTENFAPDGDLDLGDTLVATARDTETREHRILSDALYDLRATTSPLSHRAIVRAAAEALGTTATAVLDAVNRLVGSL